VSWTSFFIGVLAFLAIGLAVHFVRELRQRSAFVASLGVRFCRFALQMMQNQIQVPLVVMYHRVVLGIGRW
jgi:hypothetical protein